MNIGSLNAGLAISVEPREGAPSAGPDEKRAPENPHYKLTISDEALALARGQT